MSAPSYPLQRKRKYVDPRMLRQPMITRVMQIVEAHNAQYPLGTFKRSYYKRFKESELTTFLNILQAWSVQAARQINQGKTLVDNIVATNNRDARKDKRCKRGTPAHLAKAASVGLLLGRKAIEGDANQFQDRPEGTGCGWIPLKLFRGSCASYKLLIAPEILEGVLPQGVKLVPVEEFNDGKKAGNRDFDYLKKYGMEAGGPETKGKIMQDNLLPSETILNEGMIEVVSGDPDRVHADGNAFDGNKEKAAKPGPDLQGGLKLSPAAAKIAEETRGMSIGQLAVKGHEVARHALLLVQFYLESIAVAMRRNYHPAEIERGRLAAIELMLDHPEEERGSWINEYTATIDRIAGAIEHDPEKWAAPPGKWLHPHYEIGVRNARTRFLLPWRKTAEEFEAARNEAKTLAKAADQVEKDEAQTDWYTWLAWQMKNRFKQLHPNDTRIKSAQLGVWREQVKVLIDKDMAGDYVDWETKVREAVDVWNWFAANPSKQARFWREEAGAANKPGIRSARGFRRNFQTIRTQFFDQQEKARKAKIKAHTMPSKKQDPRILPSNKNYNPHL